MQSFIDDIFAASTRRCHTRFWLFSDLQQSSPELAERYFSAAMDDFDGLKLAIDGICYLGDASEGVNLPDIITMLTMQLGYLDALHVPIYYTMGNHELDYYRHAVCHGNDKPRIPFYDAVCKRPNWHLVRSHDQFWFAEEMPEFTMLFFTDHAALDGSWYAFHQMLPDPKGLYPFPGEYPYTKKDWEDVRDRFANTGKPIFTFAHCSFPGGNRPSAFLEQILPLPENFRAHFYGHAHIGDHYWAKKDLYRQIACVDDHPVLQFDIASLDHRRGSTVRSAIFDTYGDGKYGVFFRDHVNRRWEQFFLSEHDARSAGIPEQFLK